MQEQETVQVGAISSGARRTRSARRPRVQAALLTLLAAITGADGADLVEVPEPEQCWSADMGQLIYKFKQAIFLGTLTAMLVGM
eukprot:7966046-Alexandrium_andersonii.AAC.1